MKTALVMKTIGLTALLALAFNLNAAQGLLSPRAQDSQVKPAPSVTVERNLATENRHLVASPRALDHQNNTVQGTANSPNLATAKCNVIASPKHLTADAKSATASCCKVVATRCSALRTCCATN
ncbi:MAG: hypothetical protein IH623_16115 [Verrucomicrobia bacterium]|nr:hypothetical protein [Verrucomicrobiota bacterium]